MAEQFDSKISINGADLHTNETENDGHGGKAGRVRKLKIREVKGETQTSESCIPT